MSLRYVIIFYNIFTKCLLYLYYVLQYFSCFIYLLYLIIFYCYILCRSPPRRSGGAGPSELRIDVTVCLLYITVCLLYFTITVSYFSTENREELLSRRCGWPPRSPATPRVPDSSFCAQRRPSPAHRSRSWTPALPDGADLRDWLAAVGRTSPLATPQDRSRGTGGAATALAMA